MGASYQLLEEAESLRGAEELDSEQSASDVLQSLCVEHPACRDLLGNLRNLQLPDGVTLEDVLDAVVGLSAGHAILRSKTPCPADRPGS
jgi:hypothetical protein